MNRKFLSVVLSMMLIVTSCFLPCTSVAAIGTDDTAQSNASVEIAESNADDTVELVFYSYLMDGVSQPDHKQYVQQQKKVVKANRGDEIKLKVNMKAKDEPYLSTLSIRYDLTEEDDIEGLFGKNGLMESSQANFIANHIPRRNKSLLQYKSIKMNDVIQSKCDKYYDDGDIFYDLGAFSQYSLSDKFDAFSIIPSEFISDSSAEFAQMKEDMHFTESEGGDEYCTITFKVSEDISLGNQQTCVIYAPEFQKAIAQGNVVQVTEMTMDVTGSSYSEPATEKPTAKPTEKPTTTPSTDKAIIHLVDDNVRETLVLNVGDTFEYPVYVKLDSARVYAMTARTYFNQPVGTRNKPNAEGYMEPNAPKVLDIKSKRNDISAYWKNLDTSTDVIKDSRGYELCRSPIGAYDSTTGKFNYVETYYGAFNQASGCLLYKVKFTVMEPGEVEVFTFMEEAISKYTENSSGVLVPTHANYVAIYNEEQTEVPTEKPTEKPTTPPTGDKAIIHLVDDNARETLVLNVGDTFEYPVYVKLDSARVYAMTARTYFNQPVGTRNKPNAEGYMEPNAPKVLDIVSKRNDISAYWKNLDTSTDVIKDSRGYELCMSPIGAYDSTTGKFNYVETYYGAFNQASGCLLYKVKFTVMEPGEVEVFTFMDEAIAKYTENSAGVIIPTKANYVAIYNEEQKEVPTEKPTEITTEAGQAIIHIVDDNKREPLVLNVGDTFEYPVYVKLDSAKVYAMTARTYFNQPVGTKNKPNAEGSMEPNAPKVLDIKSKRNDIGAYWDNLDTSTDVIKDSRGYELCMSPIGAYNASTSKFSYVETHNGDFDQAGGCLLYKVKFTVMAPGEVEVFTHIEEAIADYTENSEGVVIPTHANYVAIYNQGRTVDSIKYLVGDCNGDGQVSTADLIYMQRYKLGVLSLSEKGLLGADVNCDGAVTLKDISMLQRYYIYVRYDNAPINTWKTYNP